MQAHTHIVASIYIYGLHGYRITAYDHTCIGTCTYVEVHVPSRSLAKTILELAWKISILTIATEHKNAHLTLPSIVYIHNDISVEPRRRRGRAGGGGGKKRRDVLLL